MIIAGEYTFRGPRSAVWELLQDPDVLVKAMPGTERLERTGDDDYEGLMHVTVGPITAAEFAIRVTLRDKTAPERYAMQMDGRGPFGFTRGTALVHLAERDGGGTLLTYRAELQVGGKIAGVGQRLLESVGKAMARRGLHALGQELERRLGQGGGP